MKKLFLLLKALAFLSLALFPTLSEAFGETEFKENVVISSRTLTKDKSPYLFKQDVLIRPEGELIIEPGVELRFAPEVGITVRGILNAEGTPEQKIKFVPYEEVDKFQPNRTIRLVDGPNVNEGIVQLLELGRWQSVCTNSRNWTQSDMEVACRQLGFQGGEWVFWYPHLNDTDQMLYQDPGKLKFCMVKIFIIFSQNISISRAYLRSEWFYLTRFFVTIFLSKSLWTSKSFKNSCQKMYLSKISIICIL